MKALLFTALFICTSWAFAVDQTLIYQMRGTAVGEKRMVPDYTGDGIEDEALCFDLELVDMKTNEVVGKATDCISNMQEVDKGFSLLGTSYFMVEKGIFKGKFTTRGQTTVQPQTGDSDLITHFTGSYPSEMDMNGIIETSDSFLDLKGSVRVAGAVNLSNYSEEYPEIKFDCIFIINVK